MHTPGHIALNALEGLRISLEAIRSMNERARASGRDFAVLMLPTKESVFVRALGDEIGRDSMVMSTLISRENTVRERAIAFFEQHGIRWLDAREALSAAILRGENPYFGDQDGHPNPAGHRILARLVASELRARSGTEERR